LTLAVLLLSEHSGSQVEMPAPEDLGLSSGPSIGFRKWRVGGSLAICPGASIGCGAAAERAAEQRHLLTSQRMRLALAGIIGWRLERTALMISLGSMPWR
jgi:hypothetical protein